MTSTIVFATQNPKKVEEMNTILEDSRMEILSMQDVGLCVDIKEDGKSFEENAMIKAREVMRLTGKTALADDSGLEIDYLFGAPGIYSARFGGKDTSYQIKNQLILDCLKEAKGEERTARFVCAIAVCFPNGEIKVTRGVMEGVIAEKAAGENGFGYDPIFYLPELGCTSAELSSEAKNQISHRGKALREMKQFLLC